MAGSKEKDAKFTYLHTRRHVTAKNCISANSIQCESITFMVSNEIFFAFQLFSVFSSHHVKSIGFFFSIFFAISSMFRSFSRRRQPEAQQQQQQPEQQPELVKIEERPSSPPGSPCKHKTTEVWNQASPG